MPSGVSSSSYKYSDSRNDIQCPGPSAPSGKWKRSRASPRRGGCSLRSNGEKGSGIGSLTANSSLSGPKRPGTFVRQSAVMALSGLPPFPSATAPCTSPHTSLLSPIRSDSTLLRASMRPIDKLREQIRAICSPKRSSDDRGEQNGIVCTPMGSSAGRHVQKGSFCTPDGPSDVLGVQERRVCTPTAEKQCSVSRLACFAHQRG